jgi:hypothetical protein
MCAGIEPPGSGVQCGGLHALHQPACRYQSQERSGNQGKNPGDLEPRYCKGSLRYVCQELKKRSWN